MVSNRIKHTLAMTLLAMTIYGCDSIIDNSKTGDSNNNSINDSNVSTVDNSVHDNNGTVNIGTTPTSNPTGSNTVYGDDTDAVVNVELYRNEITNINQSTASGATNPITGDDEIIAFVGCLNKVTFAIEGAGGGQVLPVKTYEETEGMDRGTRYGEYFKIVNPDSNAAYKVYATINGAKTLIGTWDKQEQSR